MTSENILSTGDVVKLASEDKLMTVCSINHNTAECLWLDPGLKPVYHEFLVSTLILVYKKGLWP